MKSKPSKKKTILNVLGWLGAIALFAGGLTAVLAITPKSKAVSATGTTPVAKP